MTEFTETQELARKLYAEFDAMFSEGEANADPNLAWIDQLATEYGVPSSYVEMELQHYYQEKGYNSGSDER